MGIWAIPKNRNTRFVVGRLNSLAYYGFPLVHIANQVPLISPAQLRFPAWPYFVAWLPFPAFNRGCRRANVSTVPGHQPACAKCSGYLVDNIRAGLPIGINQQ
jgi:hypothetical protein